MNKTKKNAVAIITARGGSKRIPGKNIKEFCGKPILFYSIQAAIQSGIFDEVMVSTDDREIAEIAKEAGACVPFMRSETNSGDFATTDAVIQEVLTSYEKLGLEFEFFCCIYPTAPFLTPQRLKEAMNLLSCGENGSPVDSVMPVTPFSYPPQRGLIIEAGRLKPQYPQYRNTRSQDLEKIYHDCGQFYACRTQAFLAAGTTDVENLVPIVLPETEVQDIDTPEDLSLAEWKYRWLEKQKNMEQKEHGKK